MNQSILTGLQDGTRVVLADAILDIVSLALEIVQGRSSQLDMNNRIDRFRHEGGQFPELAALAQLDNTTLLRRFLAEGRALI